ncbi:MAG: glucose-6-phosphate dehydrogenase, partial [Planctomycetales bacterium]|nr:glucose-6-phosphate dehydrogenase [Planctomycetales bacterium]
MAHTVVIFGASGDLTARKLIPALYRLFLRSRLPEQTKIVGVARSEFTDFSWREQLTQTIAEHAGDEYQAEKWMEFSNLLHYFVGDIKSPKDFSRLATRLSELEKNAPADRTYYISTMPQLYEAAVNQLGAAGMA